VLPVDRRALRLYRDHFGEILVVSAVVFAPLSLFSTLANQRADELLEDGGGHAAVGAIAFAASALMIFGYALCSGLLEKLVVGPDFGHRREPFREALRTLPYAKLIGLDLLTTIGVIIGLALGIVPGLVFFTFVALAPPLLVSEHRTVRSSLRRSASLVRHAFWVTFLVVTLPVLLEHELFAALELLLDLPLVLLWLAHLAAAVLVLAVVVLCETTLAFTLAERREADGEISVGDASKRAPA